MSVNFAVPHLITIVKNYEVITVDVTPVVTPCTVLYNKHASTESGSVKVNYLVRPILKLSSFLIWLNYIRLRAGIAQSVW